MASDPGPTEARAKNVDDVNTAWGNLQTFNSHTLPSKAGSIDNLAYVVSQKVGWF